MKITNEIHQVGGAGFTSPEDAAVYLLDFLFLNQEDSES